MKHPVVAGKWKYESMVRLRESTSTARIANHITGHDSIRYVSWIT